ncbi:MAG: hypothetical protein Q9204_008695, partial [Flavoplaca sp. TL-2023a]
VLCVESLGAQASDVADKEQIALKDSRASGDGAEDGRELEVTKQDGDSHEEAGIEVPGLGPGGPEAFSNIDQPETLNNDEDIQPNQPQIGRLEKPTETVKDASGDDKDQDNSDNERMTGNSPEEDSNSGESGKEDSDHDENKPDDNQDQTKESNTDDEEEGNDGPRDDSGGGPRPPKSPSKTPPQSPARSARTPPPKTPPPQTPPHQAQQGGLFANFSPSRLLGFFTPLRSGTKSEPPPETRAPSPALNLAQETIDPFADDDIPGPNAPVSSSSSDLSLLNASTDFEAPFSPLLPTPPVTPAKKHSRIIPSSILGTRRSQRTFKPRSSGRMAQMIPMNTRTAGSMGPYKPLPASRGVLVAAQGMGGRGRSSVRMSAVVVGQKRSSSASSVSSTGSSTAGYGGSGGRSGGATKRVRFATIHG